MDLKSLTKEFQNTWRQKAFSGTLSALCFATCILGALALALTVFRCSYSFDEWLHLHNLWLISIGRIPHQDFWCNYPATGYAIILPFFRLLPETLYSVLVLRFLNLLLVAGVCIILILQTRRLRVHWMWGVLPLFLFFPNGLTPWLIEYRTDALAMLLALAAFALMFRTPRPVAAGFSAGLTALSLLIMPKYLYPLVLCLIAYAVYGWCTLKSRRTFIIGLLVGGVSGVAVAQAWLMTIQVNLWDDFKWSWIFMLSYFGHLSKNGTDLPRLVVTLAHYFSADWWNALIAIAGAAGLVAVEWKNRGGPLFIGSALLAGTIIAWTTGVLPSNQYLVPGLLCLAFLVPYAPRLINKPFWPVACGVLLLAMSAFTVVKEVKAGASELGAGGAIAVLHQSNNLLQFIPRNERVVGVWRTHPCFREDQTFLTYDERWGNPKGFLPVLPQDSPIRRYFEPAGIAGSLEQSPPATIALTTTNNYPAGWNDAIRNFLQTHANSYSQIRILDDCLFIRNDLVR